jgi:plastocyanin domain-containing protein
MDPTQVLVTVLGLAGMAWVVWYFFLAQARGAAATAAPRSGLQEIAVVVDGGYQPSRITVRSGQPVRLLFDRRDTGNCTEEVVLPDFGVRRFLPTGAVTPVEFTPTQPGTHDFSCGMGMVHGKLIVQ